MSTSYLNQVGKLNEARWAEKERLARESHVPTLEETLGYSLAELKARPSAEALLRTLETEWVVPRAVRQIPEVADTIQWASEDGEPENPWIEVTYGLTEAAGEMVWALPEIQQTLIAWVEAVTAGPRPVPLEAAQRFLSVFLVSPGVDRELLVERWRQVLSAA